MPPAARDPIPAVLNALQELQPESVLHVGAEAGAWGRLLRETLRPIFIDAIVPPPRDGAASLDPAYDHVFLDVAPRRLGTRDMYDVVLVTEANGHAPPDRKALVQICLRQARKAVIVATSGAPAPEILIKEDTDRKGRHVRARPWLSPNSRLKLQRLADRLRNSISAARPQANSASFPGSALYWEQRYARGGHSGKGSYGVRAEFKARTIDAFTAAHGIASMVDFGAGDGNQLALLKIGRYTGLDVSPKAVALLRRRFVGDVSKRFYVLDGDAPVTFADLSLSCDVIFHLVEDAVFERYMRQLFAAARRYVMIYSTNQDLPVTSAHVRHRRFSDFIERHLPEWHLADRIANPHAQEMPCDFYVYERGPPPTPIASA